MNTYLLRLLILSGFSGIMKKKKDSTNKTRTNHTTIIKLTSEKRFPISSQPTTEAIPHEVALDIAGQVKTG